MLVGAFSVLLIPALLQFHPWPDACLTPDQSGAAALSYTLAAGSSEVFALRLTPEAVKRLRRANPAGVIIWRMAVLAVKLFLAPSFVVGASLVARRYGPAVGGTIAGLPVVAGPILLAYALEHGSTFAARAASGTLLGLLSLAAFVVVFGRLSPRLPWLACVLAGWLAFIAGTAVLDNVALPSGLALTLALGVVLAGFGVGLLLLPPLAGRVYGAGQRPAWDLPARAACAAALVLTLTAIAGWLGPRLSGLLAPFPIITSVLAAFTLVQRGAVEAVRLLRGMLCGFVAFALFCATLAATLEDLGTAAAFALATCVALVAQAIVLAVLRRRAAEMEEPAKVAPYLEATLVGGSRQP